MRRFAMLMGGAVVAASLGMAALAHEGEDHGTSTEGKQVTIMGELIDTACFITSEGDAKGKEHAECGTKCLATGIPAGILPEGAKNADALAILLTNPVPLAPHVAKTIRVEGKQYRHGHVIDPTKVFVQDGEKWTEIQLDDEHHKMGGDGDSHEGHDGHEGHDH